MIHRSRTVRYLALAFIFFSGLSKAISQTNDYPVQPVPFTSVEMQDSFWLPKIKTNHDVTIPYGFEKSANRLTNFEIAAGLKAGSFSSDFPFDDSDIYKMIEAASYSLHYFPDPKLEKYIDSVITIIGLAQEPDGYLYTNRTISNRNGTKPHDWAGDRRWINEHILSHELYNLGHLFESAVAWYQATGKKNLLNISIKAADLIDKDFGWRRIENYPGHQIVEVGLARLYRVTGDERYLNLAKFFLDVRGPGGEDYCQADKKVIDQSEAVGHSVRAVYMYAGMADIAALKNDPSYIKAIDRIWDDMVTKKIYITGGIGASGGNEGFSIPYHLPNSSAYCETCASIGNVYLNQRLFLLHGDSKYIDVLERTLYNALLAGVSLTGDRFFYPNPLLSTGSYQRSPWFSCACCPPNIARLVPSVPGYFYAVRNDQLYVNLFAKSTAHIGILGKQVEIRQNTSYPWEGEVELIINPSDKQHFTLMLRIPGWARNEAIPGNLYKFNENDGEVNYKITVNGEPTTASFKNGYAIISREWKKGDIISLSLPMTVREILADERLKEDSGMIAIQRGPLVFCAEGIDNGGKVLNMIFEKNADYKASFVPSLLKGTEVIETMARPMYTENYKQIRLIPYYLWNNRGPSEMQVWLSTRKVKALPDSLIIINEYAGDSSLTNYVSPWESLKSIYDLYKPLNSADKATGAFGNWMGDGSTVGKWNWVQYDFHEDKTVNYSEVYWWDDKQGITLPDSSYLSYWDDSTESFIAIPETQCERLGGCIKPDQYNRVTFKPITTRKVRLNFIGYSKAQGILEWSLYSNK